MTTDSSNPVETLSLPLRLAAGPVVSKLYEAKHPPFMKRVENIGPHGAALLTCCQVLAGYSLACMFAAFIALGTPEAGISSILFPLSVIFALWTVAVMFALNKIAPLFGGVRDDDKAGTA